MSTRARFVIDAVLTAAFLVSYKPGATGLGLHEWLSVGLALLGLFHAALNWDWVVHTARSFWVRLLRMSAVNLVVDALLFAATVMVMLSGLLVSRVIGPGFGLTPSMAPLWHRLHAFSADAVVVLFLVHGVLHWRWIAKTVTGWLSSSKGGSHEGDATTHRRRSGRRRVHGSRDVRRRERGDRSYA